MANCIPPLTQHNQLSSDMLLLTGNHKNVGHNSPSKCPKENSPCSSPCKSPNKRPRLLTSDEKTASLSIGKNWNQFLPAHFASISIDAPSAKIKSMTTKIFAEAVLPKQINLQVLEKIVEIVHRLQPMGYVHYKKYAEILDPINLKPMSILPASFFVVALAKRTFACFKAPGFTANGSEAKICQSVGLEFINTTEGVRFVRKFDAAKHTTPLISDDVIQGNKDRIQASVDLNGVSNMAHPYFHGLYTGASGNRKLMMLFDLYQGDLFHFLDSHRFDKDIRKVNARTVALQLGQALLQIHQKNYVHRDIKVDNVLANWVNTSPLTGPLLKTIALTDFNLSTSLNPNNERLKQACGSLLYVAPEMLAKVLKLDQLYFELEVTDPSTLFGKGLDLWGYGLILHYFLNGKFPDHVNIINSMVECSEKDGTEEDLMAIKLKWQKLMCDLIKTQKNTPLPEETTLETFISGLLQIDPRRRLNSTQIQAALAKL